MATKHEITQACPICSDTVLYHAHCSHASCEFVVTACARCDRAQVVAAFVADHEKDCAHGPNVLVSLRGSVFAAPRKAA